MGNWQNCIEAARRKIKISDYHYLKLKELEDDFNTNDNGKPTIPIQAHFEGVIQSIIASIDQVAQAANLFWSLNLTPAELFEITFSKIEEVIPDFKKWRDNPIGKDLRSIRTKMLHHSYDKSFKQSWQVQNAYNSYDGDRELLAYCNNAISYAKELDELINKLDIQIFRKVTL